MPDGDVIFQKLVPCWRRSYNLLKGGGSDATIVGSAIVKAVAKNLRVSKGAPGIHEIASVVEDFTRAGGTVPMALGKLRAIERAHRGHVHTRLAAQVASQLIAETQRGAPPPADLARATAERFCEQMVTHNLFSRVLPGLIGTRFTDYQDAAAFQRSIMAAIKPSLDREAAALLANPSAVGLRAPHIAGVRRSTAHTLYTPI
jgi:hypothetical protein